MYAGGSDAINVSIFVSHLVATYDPKAQGWVNNVNKKIKNELLNRSA